MKLSQKAFVRPDERRLNIALHHNRDRLSFDLIGLQCIAYRPRFTSQSVPERTWLLSIEKITCIFGNNYLLHIYGACLNCLKYVHEAAICGPVANSALDVISDVKGINTFCKGWLKIR